MNAPWSHEYMPLITEFEKRHSAPEAAVLFIWATMCVDTLNYLADLDACHDSSRRTDSNHTCDVIDLAHARWATTTSKTAIDLLAAGLGKTFCELRNGRHLDIADFNPTPNDKHKIKNRACLPQALREWVDDLCADMDFKLVKEARDALTHKRLLRRLTLQFNEAEPNERLRFEVGNEEVESKTLIAKSRDLASSQVSKLLSLLANI